jgi:hypothetical protein
LWKSGQRAENWHLLEKDVIAARLHHIEATAPGNITMWSFLFKIRLIPEYRNRTEKKLFEEAFLARESAAHEYE